MFQEYSNQDGVYEIQMQLIYWVPVLCSFLVLGLGVDFFIFFFLFSDFTRGPPNSRFVFLCWGVIKYPFTHYSTFIY